MPEAKWVTSQLSRPSEMAPVIVAASSVTSRLRAVRTPSPAGPLVAVYSSPSMAAVLRMLPLMTELRIVTTGAAPEFSVPEPLSELWMSLTMQLESPERYIVWA